MAERIQYPELPSRTLDELVTFHEYEPDELTVLTEGPADRGFFTWFLDASGLQRVVVYDITSLDISVAEVLEQGYENSNRGRVLVTAAAARRAGIRSCQLVCIVDKDLDSLLERSIDEPHVVVTDFACLEMYAWNPRTLSKFLSLNRAGTSAQNILENLRSVLHRLFLTRGANALLAWSLQAVDWTRSVEICEDVVAFNETDYIKRYLMRNGRMSSVDDFTDMISTLSTRLNGDSRDFINGQDCIEATSWFLRKTKSSWSLKGFALRDNLLACIEYTDLSRESLFRELQSRLTASTKRSDLDVAPSA